MTLDGGLNGANNYVSTFGRRRFIFIPQRKMQMLSTTHVSTSSGGGFVQESKTMEANEHK